MDSINGDGGGWMRQKGSAIGVGNTFPNAPCMEYLSTYIHQKVKPNVGEYSIHGAYGLPIVMRMQVTQCACYKTLLEGAAPVLRKDDFVHQGCQPS